ncbi:MAG: hypothetical protein ACE5GC_01680 [Acidimicrobiia bacterium]
MLRAGTRVTRLMQRVGQRAPTGKITAVRGRTYEIRWDDGHTSISDPIGVIPVKRQPGS